MPSQIESRLARHLESGNFHCPVISPGGYRLPQEDEIRSRINDFLILSKTTGASVDTPARLRKEMDHLLDLMYRGKPLPKEVLRGPAVEAVTIADGSRPVFFFVGDRLQKCAAANGPFVDAVEQKSAPIEEAALSVGRIETDDKLPAKDMDRWFDGTAFLVSDGLAMTNRHVMERLVNEPQNAAPPFTLKARYWLNFDAQFGSQGSRRLEVKRVVFAGPRVIGAGGDLTKLDMALLEIDGPAPTGAACPAPLTLSGRPLNTFEAIAVIGYPAAPMIYTGTGTPPAGYESEDVLRRVFDARFGWKRCASGEVEAAAGTIAGDPQRWCVRHDASTLGGNSGSPVLRLSDGRLEVAALHFGGLPREPNYAHVFDQLSADLGRFNVALAS